MSRQNHRAHSNRWSYWPTGPDELNRIGIVFEIVAIALLVGAGLAGMLIDPPWNYFWAAVLVNAAIGKALWGIWLRSKASR